MTNIIYDKIGDSYLIRIDGHAGYNPGIDIVCSACSMIAYTLAESLSRQRTNSLETTFEDGHCEIRCCAMDNDDTINTIFDTCMAGFELLADEYPNNVQIL